MATNVGNIVLKSKSAEDHVPAVVSARWQAGINIGQRKLFAKDISFTAKS